MVWQDADRNCFKRMVISNGPIGSSQEDNVLDQEIARSIGQRYRKEEGAAIVLRAYKSRHRSGAFPVVGMALRAFAHPTI
jgi:hypothetical protein